MRIKKDLTLRFPWEGATEAWVRSTSSKQLWRVDGHMSYDDLIQEGYVVYMTCLQKYEHKANNQRWFMSLFMRAFTNRITDLANARTKYPDALDEDVMELESPESMEPDAFLDLLPEELKEVAMAFINAPEELFSQLSRMWNVSGHRQRGRSTAIRQLSGTLGLDGKDVRGEIHKVIKGD